MYKKQKNEVSDSTAYNHRDPSDHVEFTDQHHPARQNDHVYGDPGGPKQV